MTQPPSSNHVALIPAWNEASRIPGVIQRAKEWMPVLVVDDGSVDGSGPAAEAAGATVIRHEFNRGKGAALLTGFHWALSRGFDGVVTLDADGQHDPSEIGSFLQLQSEAGADLVIGRRDFSQMPFPRSVTNPFGSWLLGNVLGTTIYDNQCGFRLYQRPVLELADKDALGFEFEVNIIMETVMAGLKLVWVDVRTIYGIGKASYFHPIRDSAQFMLAVWRAWQRRRAQTI